MKDSINWLLAIIAFVAAMGMYFLVTKNNNNIEPEMRDMRGVITCYIGEEIAFSREIASSTDTDNNIIYMAEPDGGTNVIEYCIIEYQPPQTF